MTTKIYVLLCVCSLICACSNVSKNDKQEKNLSGKTENDSSSNKLACAKPIKDPNHPKSMALMMRQMAGNADSMKAQLLRGEKLDVLHYPFIRFYLAEPTDSSVLEMKFYDNARLFQEAYITMFKHPTDIKYFNLVVAKCVNCHESYCNGPLKRIKKLYISN